VDVKERLDEICDRIKASTIKSGRMAGDVTLIAVSKTFPSSAVTGVSSLGQVDFGENKVQELVLKSGELENGTSDHPIRWHMIGHLQRNKAKDIVGRADMFHALDSVRLASALQARLKAEELTLDCLIQVNISAEDSKFGILPDELKLFAEQIAPLDAINIRGLMTLASPTNSPESVRPEFAQMRDLSEMLTECLGYPTPVLSMGMSSDFEVAIEEGATHVRIGSAIFGARTYLNT